MPYIVILVDWGIQALVLLVIVSSLLSWIKFDPRNPLVRLLQAIVEPLLHPIRAMLPSAGGLDFSPAVAILILYLLQSMIHYSILH